MIVLVNQYYLFFQLIWLFLCIELHPCRFSNKLIKYTATIFTVSIYFIFHFNFILFKLINFLIIIHPLLFQVFNYLYVHFFTHFYSRKKDNSKSLFYRYDILQYTSNLFTPAHTTPWSIENVIKQLFQLVLITYESCFN